MASAADLLTDEQELQLVGTIAEAAEGDWKAAAWLLERGWPDRWQRRSIQQRHKADEPDEASTAVTGTEQQQRDAADPFAEVDDLASRRSQRSR